MRCMRLLMMGLLICWPAVSQGAVLTFGFEGSVDHIGYDPLAPVDIQVGDKLVYEYTFDTNPPYVGGGIYGAIGASITVGDDRFPVVPPSTGEPAVQLLPSISNPGLLTVWSSVEFDVPNASRSGNVAVMLTGVLRPGNESPPWWPLLSPPDLSADFTSAMWSAYIFGQEYNDPPYGLSGTVTRSYVVPEPITAVLVAFAGIAFAGKRRHS